MAEREILRKWARRKIDKGMPDDRVKEILRERGEDPSVVDEISNPFDGEEKENSSEEEEEPEEDNTSSNEIPPEQDFSKPNIPYWDVAASVLLLILLVLTGLLAQNFGAVSATFSGAGVFTGCSEAGMAVLDTGKSGRTATVEIATNGQDLRAEVNWKKGDQTVRTDETVVEGSQEITANVEADRVKVRSVECQDLIVRENLN